MNNNSNQNFFLVFDIQQSVTPGENTQNEFEINTEHACIGFIRPNNVCIYVHTFYVCTLYNNINIIMQH